MSSVGPLSRTRPDPAHPAGRERFLPFHRPSIDETDVQAVAEAVRSGWLTHGRLCQRFEAEFQETVGAARAVAVSSGTAAMHLSLVALGVGEGAEVITTPFTFCATALVIEQAGAIPVLVDIDPATLQIDPTRIDAAMTDRTRAILPVHYGGHPCDMATIVPLAAERGVPVIEDAAHALGASIAGRAIGSLGDATCFSFYATKNITTGEGGMVTTNHVDLADRIERLRLHGISRDAWRRYEQGGNWFYEVLENGYKANLTDIQAALGMSQLAKEPAMRLRRQDIARRYTEAFSGYPDFLEPPIVSPGVEPAWHLYPLRLRVDTLTIGRNEFILQLERLNVGTSVHFIPVHLHPHFRERYGFRTGDFPHAEEAYRTVVSLPIYPSMSRDDVEYVIDCVLHLVGSHAA